MSNTFILKLYSSHYILLYFGVLSRQVFASPSPNMKLILYEKHVGPKTGRRAEELRIRKGTQKLTWSIAPNSSAH